MVKSTVPSIQKVLDGMPVPKSEDKSASPSTLTRQESDDPSSHSDTELKGRIRAPKGADRSSNGNKRYYSSRKEPDRGHDQAKHK